jgi:hypothetical protein
MRLANHQILRNPDDPNDLMLLVGVESVEQARLILEPEQFQAAMQRGRFQERTVFFPEV